jgi:putative protease
VRWAVPVCDPDEVESLYEHGADELYCGILDTQWCKRWGGHDTISRRAGRANLSSTDAAWEVLKRAHAVKLPVYLTLNARYTGEQYAYLCNLLSAWDAHGGDGVHLSDMGLLLRASRMRLQTRLSVSLLSVTVNRACAELYRELGVSRVVLPRMLMPDEMCDAGAGLEREAMVFADKCPFVDGLCRFYHGVGYADSPYAPTRTEMVYDTCFRNMACRELFGEPPASPPCAACRIEDLEKAGVTIGKLGGRGTPLPWRIRQLDFLTDAAKIPQKERPALYRERFGTCVCYYGR